MKIRIRSSLLAAACLAVVGPASAQDPAGEATATTLRREPATPLVRVVGFRDQDATVVGDCDPTEARLGHCIELVDFLDPARSFGDGVANDRSERSEWRNIGSLYTRIWEDLAYRWNKSEAVDGVFQVNGVSRMPTTGAHLEAVGGSGNPLYAMPHHSYWVDPATFLPRHPSDPQSGVFRYVRYNHEPGTFAPPTYAVLHGRFGSRLVYDEEVRVFDFMDADNQPSAPFFEHLYPYRTARFFGANDLGFEGDAADHHLAVPLRHFEVPGELRTPPRLMGNLSPGVGEDPTRVLTEAEVRALEEQITLTQIRRQHFAPLAFVPGEGIADMREIAMREYDAFYRDIGAQVVKFGRQNYTQTHIRVLASLFAMQAPPGTNRPFVDQSDDAALSAAQLAELARDEGGDAPVEAPAAPEEAPPPPVGDEEDWYTYEDEAPAAPTPVANDAAVYRDDVLADERSSVRIVYGALPPRIVRAHLKHLSSMQAMDLGFATWLHDTYTAEPDRRSLLKDRARAMEPEDGEDITDWITRYAARYAKGANERVIEEGMSRIALQRIVRDQRLADLARGDLIETSMLLDHVRHAVVEKYVPTTDPTAYATPVELEDVVSKVWLDVLAQHDYIPVPLEEPQVGAGRDPAYDPLSVCTQAADFTAAGEERVFGAANIDLMFLAPDGTALDDPYAALWAARDRLPFLMVDDPRPSGQVPVLTRIVGLPDGRALYRARWQVWTGWHLFWGTEALGNVQWKGEVPASLADSHLSWTRRHFDWLREHAGTPVVMEGANRVALRTGAICTDVVLADPEVVPSLVRAAMLDGEFRPTIPYTKGKNSPDVRSKDARFAGRETGNRNVAARNRLAAVGVAADALADSTELEPVDALSPRNPSENVEYVRDLVEQALPRLGAEDEAVPTALFVFDTQHADYGLRTSQMKPRVPYFRDQRSGADGDHVRTSAWALAVPPVATGGETAMLSPDWVDTASVTSEAANPRWRQRRTAHFTMSGDLGFIPLRTAYTSCAEVDATVAAQGSAVVEPCAKPWEDPDTVQVPVHASGVTGSYSVLQTLWLGSNQRIAAEYGVNANFSLLFASIPAFTPDPPDDDDDGEPDYPLYPLKLTRLIMGGPVVGLRFAFAPRPLFKSSGRGAVWGAKANDESTRRARTHVGIRVGGVAGPAYSGFEGQAFADLWAGFSVTPARATNRMFTAYHPSFLVGPYAQLTVGGTMARDTENARAYDLDLTRGFTVGVRIQARTFKYGDQEFAIGSE